MRSPLLAFLLDYFDYLYNQLLELLPGDLSVSVYVKGLRQVINLSEGRFLDMKGAGQTFDELSELILF